MRRLMPSPARLRVTALAGLAAWALATPALGGRLDASAVAADAQAVPSGGAIVIDGRFDEPAWREAPVLGEFVQREPAEGAEPSERTEARVVFDDTAMYVAIQAHDREPNRIVGMLTRRDERSPSDVVKVVIDSFFDRRTAYEFAVNPAGVKSDTYYFNDWQDDSSWDAVWDVEVARDTGGWRAEFRIPFSQLRFSRPDGPIGFAVIREFPRANEIDTWPLIARSAQGFVSQLGQLNGVRLGGSPKRLELMPYTVGKTEVATKEATNPLSRHIDPGATLGVDLKYAVTPGLTLTATLNPDFGQVEADPAAVNLDAFELFFAERRPFFVEGSGVFNFNMDCNDGACSGLLYSRRIGRAPQGSATTEDDEFADAPVAATILGAAKLTGRVGGFSVGALSAVTQEERAVIASGLARRKQSVEPFTSFNVLRTRREFRDNSNLGVMFTSTTRRLTTDTRFLPDQAFVLGVDYDWRFWRRYSLQGFWSGSRVSGEAAAITRLQRNAVHYFQRPDADYLDLDAASTTLNGHAGNVAFQKISGERVRFAANYGFKSPGFETNDLGFQRRADERSMNHWLQWRNNTPGRFKRSYMVNFNQYASWNFGGDQLFGGGNINMHWQWQNNWSNGFGVNLNAGGVRDRSTRGGPVVKVNSSVGVWHYVNFDERRPLFLGYGGFVGGDGQGTFQFNGNPTITWRPNRAARVQAGLRFNLNNDDAQWIENESDAAGVTRYVFGRLQQRTVAMTFRANYTMSPNLSFQSYAEPFVSAGRYSKFRVLADGRAAEYPDRFLPYPYADNADFNFRSFRTTNVLRWEYRPGSALFVVWQQGRQERQEFGDFRFGRDFGDLFTAPSRNTFLVKFSYWFNS
jgi:Domain of unknown function (DUF5916)/Carbohydrate family 9 binding domain-like